MKQVYLDNTPAWALMSPAEQEAQDVEERRAHRNRVVLLAFLMLPLIAAVMLG
jgi:hypothetical protein